MRQGRWALGAIAAAALAFAGVMPAAAAGKKVMLVLDASGSMWGQVDGRAKIDIARETIAKILDGWRPEDELGLVVYGHREKGSCSDIEVVRPVGPVDKGSFEALVDGISPKGKTPMADAVVAAARELKSSEEPATVILVSDGIETCNADPCAVAAELERSGVGFTMHTIGFDVADDRARAQLTCMAELTGGIPIFAQDAPQLLAALERAVEATQRSDETPEPKVVAQPKLEPKPQYNLTAQAVLAPGSDPVSSDVRWDIYPADSDTATTIYGPVLETNLEPGRYKVVATVDKVTASGEVEVAADRQARLELPLDAAVVALRGVRQQGQADAEAKDTAWEIWPEGAANYVWFSYDPEPTATIPAGRYEARLKVGAATAKQTFEVAAGDSLKLEINLGAGSVRLSTLLAEGGAPIGKDMSYEIWPEGANKYLAYSYDAEPSFDLPAGRYEARIKHGAASTALRFDVAPGDHETLVATLNAGIVQASARRSEGGAPIEKDLAWEVWPEGASNYLTYSYEARPSFVLPEGRYAVKVKIGAVNIERAVEVAAGTTQALDVIGGVGRINARALFARGGPEIKKDLYFEVLPGEEERDDEKAIADSYEPAPAFDVPAGRHRVRARVGKVVASTLVDVPADGKVTAAITLDAGLLAVEAPGAEKIEILGSETDIYGEREAIETYYEPQAQVVLKAGSYVVRATSNGEAAEAEATIAPGKRAEVKLGR